MSIAHTENGAVVPPVDPAPAVSASEAGSVAPQGVPPGQPVQQPPVIPAPEPVAPRVAVDAEDASLGVTSDGKVHSVPQDAFARLKEREREKGRREAQAALDARLDEMAKSHGFTTYAAFMKAVFESRTAPAAVAAPVETAPKDTPVQPTEPEEPMATTTVIDDKTKDDDKRRDRLNQRARLRFRKEREQHSSKMVEMRRKNVAEVKRRKVLESQLRRKGTEMELREIAIGSGCTELDYSMDLLRREMRGKSAEELAEFKPATFFEGLRKTKPFLFSETHAPATTGPTNGADTPAPPSPGDAAAAAGDGAKKNALEMTEDEYKDYLKSKGLSINSSTPGGVAQVFK